MKNATFCLTALLCLIFGTASAQETFEDKAKVIAEKIETITKEEKDALKTEIEAVNLQLENGSLSAAQADEKKQQLAEARANNIEVRVAPAKRELEDLIQQKVDGKIAEKDKNEIVGITITHRNNGEGDSEKRTTSQGVIAFGFNNLVTNGAVANSDFYYLRSTFFEWGFTFNTRLLHDSNLLHAKYGLSFMYNHLTATENRYFVDNGQTTDLEVHPLGLRAKDTHFKNVYLTLPVHLEFDFSKTKVEDGKKVFRSHNGFRVGLGGYVGYNTNSKQFLSYKIDGYRYNTRQKGSWNVEDFNYGLSAYVGYKEVSLYVKYDLSPMFKNNTIDQHNASAGIRFDFN